MNTEYILKGARVVDPSRKLDEKIDIGISDGKICPPEKVKNPVIVKLNGKIVAPGFIDLHVHLRQPGRSDKETIRTGTMAAAAGGFTSIVAMPNTSPPADSQSAIEYVKGHAEREGAVKVFIAGCITKGQEGKEMAGIGGLRKAGVVAITDDGKCVHNHEIMKHVLEYSKSFKMPIFDHCEDETLSGGGVMHEGYWSTVLGLRGIPAESEELMVSRDIILAEKVGWKVHIQHVSSAGSLRLIRDAQRRKLQITCEVTPHHIALTDEKVKTFDTNYKMNPPLRSEEHRLALIAGLVDGTITAIATDHAPHTETEKLVEFDYAPFGIVGLETAVSICLTELYHKEQLDLMSFISKFTDGPAKILGIDSIGRLDEGTSADITILDLDYEHVIDHNSFFSKSRNTPFGGWKVKGRAAATIVNGRFVFSSIPGVSALIKI